MPGQQAMTAATFYGQSDQGSQMAAAGNNNQQMRPGDWICPRCSDLVFARNDQCRRCSTPRPTSAGGQLTNSVNAHTKSVNDWNNSQKVKLENGGIVLAPTSSNLQTPRAGDWICPSCGDLQFARNTACRRCGSQRSDISQSQQVVSAYGGPGSGINSSISSLMHGSQNEMRPGDWICPRCSDHVFARNSVCRRCSTPKSGSDGSYGHGHTNYGHGQSQGYGQASQMGYAATSYMTQTMGSSQKVMPGDWYCPKCKDLQFARNTVCRMCSTPRPADTSADNDDRGRSRSPHRVS